MPKGYWIAHIDVTDAENFPKYPPVSTAAITKHGGRFIVRDGEAEIVEGTLKGRHVIVEFPSLADAKACYFSEEYGEALRFRNAWATSDLVIVEGRDS